MANKIVLVDYLTVGVLKEYPRDVSIEINNICFLLPPSEAKALTRAIDQILEEMKDSNKTIEITDYEIQ